MTGTDGLVTWIVDGDTIEATVSGQDTDIRLAGINAPEREECFYEEAQNHLIDTLKGSEVTLEPLGEDQFDRTLAHVFVRERHINLEMVSMGLAIATTPDEGDPYRSTLLDAEDDAVAGAAGFWAPEACGPSEGDGLIEFDTGASMTDPAGPDEETLGDESVAIVNRGVSPVDLTGWTLRDESSRHRYSFASGTILQPEETLRIRSDDPGWDPGGEPVWNNDGDMALLMDPQGNIVARWRY